MLFFLSQHWPCQSLHLYVRRINSQSTKNELHRLYTPTLWCHDVMDIEMAQLWFVPDPSDGSLPSCKWGNLTAFLRNSRRHAPFCSIPLGILREFRVHWWLSQQKWLPPYRDLFSLYLYHVVHINVDLKWSYTLDYIATLFRSPIYALHRLAVRAIQCKVVLFLFELFC